MAKKLPDLPEQKTERFEMRSRKSFLRKIDDWRAAQRPARIPSRAEAIETLAELGLARDTNGKERRRGAA